LASVALLMRLWFAGSSPKSRASVGARAANFEFPLLVHFCKKFFLPWNANARTFQLPAHRATQVRPAFVPCAEGT
jgi:hypothetical protein